MLFKFILLFVFYFRNKKIFFCLKFVWKKFTMEWKLLLKCCDKSILWKNFSKNCFVFLGQCVQFYFFSSFQSEQWQIKSKYSENKINEKPSKISTSIYWIIYLIFYTILNTILCQILWHVCSWNHFFLKYYIR